MKDFIQNTKVLTAFIAVVIIMSGCSSATFIDSYPTGANLYLDGESVGTTPYEMVDTKPSFTCTSVRIEKEGHKIFYTNICRDEEVDVGAIVGGFICTVPFLWTFKYKPTHFYQLREVENTIEEKTEEVSSDFEELIKEQEELDEVGEEEVEK